MTEKLREVVAGLEFTLPCQMLIDQNRYIGKDPVGHACSNPMAYEYQGYRVCESCKEMILKEPMRITFPAS